MPLESISSPDQYEPQTLYAKFLELYNSKATQEWESSLVREGIVHKREGHLRAQRIKAMRLDADEFSVLGLYALSRARSKSIQFVPERIAEQAQTTTSALEASTEGLFSKLRVNTLPQAQVMAELLGVLPLTVPQTDGTLVTAGQVETRTSAYRNLRDYQIALLLLDLKGIDEKEFRRKYALPLDQDKYPHQRYRIGVELDIDGYNKALIITRFLKQLGELPTAQFADPDYSGYFQSPIDLLTAKAAIAPLLTEAMLQTFRETAQYFSTHSNVASTHAYGDTEGARELNRLLGEKGDYYSIERLVLRIEGKDYASIPRQMIRDTQRKTVSLAEAHAYTLQALNAEEIRLTGSQGESFKLTPEHRKIMTALMNNKVTIVEISLMAGMPEDQVRNLVPTIRSMLGVNRNVEARDKLQELAEARKQKIKQRRLESAEASPRLYGYYFEPATEDEERTPILHVRDLYKYLQSIPAIRWQGYQPFIVEKVNVDDVMAIRKDIDVNDPESVARFGIIIEKIPYQIATAPGKYFVQEIVGPTLTRAIPVDPPEEK